MSQAGYTPIQLYYSTTAAATPSAGNLANGELAVNITDGKLFYKDNGGTVRVLAGTGGSGVVAGSNTQVQFNNNGVFGASSGLTWDGTNLTASQLRSSGLTSGRVTYASTSGLLVDSANMTFNGTRLTVADLADSGLTSGRVVYSTAGGALVDSANLLYSGTDLTVYGVTVGRGAGAVSTNTAVGALALINNTTGNEQTAVGYGALSQNTSGVYNTAVGLNSIALNTTGNANTAIGQYSLYSNTTGSNNLALGSQALYFNTTASNNTAVGHQAGYSNTTGALNTFVGLSSGAGNTTGSGTVAVGYRAGTSATTGGYNTFVGLNSGENVTTATLNSFFGIGSGGAVTTGSRNTILGVYNGNQGGLDIRSSNNNIVLSDGDGNPMLWGYGQTEWLMRSGASGLWTLYSNGGGNNSTYNGTLIGANKGSLAGQANGSLPSWFIDIGGRAADGSTRPVSTADKFSVGRQAAGGSLIGAANLFEVNANGAVGLNTTAASTGTGITFPATQNASSNANTLDDYEEGTFTPVILSDSAGNFTMTVQYGRYTKIGRVVTIQVYIAWSARPSGGSVTFSTFPFNINNGGTTGGNTATAFQVLSATDSALLNNNLSFDGTSDSQTIYAYNFARSALTGVNSLSSAGFVAYSGTYYVS